MLKQKGFSLIELTIIVVIVSMIFVPAFIGRVQPAQSVTHSLEIANDSIFDN